MAQIVGIFGGTFDPIHLGHLKSVSLLDELLSFDRLHWVLSARPPHKDSVNASIDHRYSMLELALSGYDHFYADDVEIGRPEKSYTFDTVTLFKEKYPNSQLCLIIGGDSLQKLHTWSRYEELIETVHIVVMRRPGYDFEIPSYLENRQVTFDQLPEFKAGKLVLFDQSKFDISSSELRKALMQTNPKKSDREQIQKFISEPVLDYIYQHRLYKKV